MAICCGGKKQKVSHSVTSSINHRRSKEKQNCINDHHRQHSLKSNPSPINLRHRSHSQFNHHSAMPHDYSRLTTNSGSSSAFIQNYGTSQSTKNKMIISDDDDDDDDNENEDNRRSSTLDNEHKHKNRIQQFFDRSNKSAKKLSIVQADMIFYCFEILGNYLFNGKSYLGKYHSSTTSNGQLSLTPQLPASLPIEPYPLFVTWLIGSEQKLRGCIGTFTPMNLAQGLREYALTSATNDSRFSPISRDEYPLLSCAVSILTQFEPCSSYSDWDIGLHGIRIEFLNERGSKRSATYLPEVAHEQGWNHIQTLDSLLRKGGYKAAITPDIRKSVQVTRYQSEKLTLHYNDYIQSKTNSPLTFTTLRQQF